MDQHYPSDFHLHLLRNRKEKPSLAQEPMFLIPTNDSQYLHNIYNEPGILNALHLLTNLSS